MAATHLLPSEAIHDTFRGWHAERELLDSQLSESLAALEAYQSHLDAWQEQLAHERDELRQLRRELDSGRAALEESQVQVSVEAVTELELSRARESELRASLDEQKRTLEQERAHWAEEIRRLNELLERRLETPSVEESVVPTELHPAAVLPPRTASARVEFNSGNPVLGSIVEQFGKLRQQRAFDRQTTKRPR